MEEFIWGFYVGVAVVIGCEYIVSKMNDNK